MDAKLIFCSTLLVALALPLGAGGASAQSRAEREARYFNKVQPGRIESAEAIIAQAETYKMKATQFHIDSAALIKDAAKLRGQAGAADPNARKTYEADLAAFKDHANAYAAHKAEVERTIGVCKAAQAQYEQMLQQFTLHTEMFHQQNLPNVQPPHVCPHMGMQVQEAQRLNNQMRIDAERVANSEADLAEAEDRLATAGMRNQAADAPLAQRSKVLDAERQLTGEFAALKTEYDLLSNEHQALTASGTLKGPAISKVTGKIK